MPIFRLFSLLTVILLAACGNVEDTRPGQPVKTRQMAFKDILRSFEPMGVMLRDNRYDAGKFAALAAEVITKRDAPWPHFGPDTNYPPTKATDKVWREPEQFERDRKALFTASDELLAAAESKDKQRIEAAYKATYDACQTCHKQFKER